MRIASKISFTLVVSVLVAVARADAFQPRNSIQQGTFLSKIKRSGTVKDAIKMTSTEWSSPSESSVSAVAAAPTRKISWMSPTGQDGELGREALAGFVAALATIPTSMAYAGIVGLSPLTGIWSSAILGLTIAIIGGGPGLIAGSAGVVAIPMAKLIQTFGFPYMFPTVLLASAIELGFGLLKLGKLINYISEPVVAGFINAFAVFLVKSQLKVFTSLPTYGPAWNASVGLAGLCIAILQLLPRITKAVPAPLVGLVVSSVVAMVLKLPVKTLRDKVPDPSIFAGGISSLPSIATFTIPSFTVPGVVSTIVSTAVGIAVIAMVETVLAAQVATNGYRSKAAVYEKDDPDRQLIGLGLGSALTSIIGGFGGCGLIPNTLLNAKSGGVGYASQFSFALSLCLAVLVFAPQIAFIPGAAIAGVMLNVANNTFEWAETIHVFKAGFKGLVDTISGKIAEKDSVKDLIAHLATFILCLKVDMMTGVLAGVAITHFSSAMGSISKKLSGKTA